MPMPLMDDICVFMRVGGFFEVVNIGASATKEMITL